MAKTHPETLKKINSLKITHDIKETVTNLASDIEEERAYRSVWENKIDVLRRLRYGVRKSKSTPWLNASNFSIPLIDADINRVKPSYVNLAFSVSPVVMFEPFGPEDVGPARKKEMLFDWRMRTKVKFFEPYVTGIDKMLEQGQVIFKIMWDYSTRVYEETLDILDLPENVQQILYDPMMTDETLEKIIEEELRVDLDHEENLDAIKKAVEDFRNGETLLTMEFVETEDNQPRVVVCDLREDLFVPVDTMHINDARWIDYIFPMTVNEIKIAMGDGKYEEYSDVDIESWAGKSPKHRDLLVDVDDEVVWIHESCVWKDINDDGIKERCITTWPDASPDSVLRFIELPYDHSKWPYVQIKRELIDPSFYSSRGIPELDEDFQKGITELFNQTVDAGTIMNNPQVVYKTNSVVNLRNIRYTPGERVEVRSQTKDYEIRQLTNVAQPANLQLTQFLKGWSDQRMGSISSGISDETNLHGQGQQGKKTATEVNLVQSLAGQVQSLDLQVFQQQMAEVYYQISALYDQFGDEEETILLTNEKPQKISRREIQGKFNIVPNGRIDNSTPQMRLAKSVGAMQFFNQDPFVDQRKLREMIMQDMDPRMSKLLLKSPEQLQKEQQQAQQARQAAEGQAIQKQLAIKKAVDDTDIRKEFILTPLTGRRFAAD